MDCSDPHSREGQVGEFNRRYGSVGIIGAPFYMLMEVFSPAIEVLAMASFVAAVALGIFDVEVFLVVVAAMAFVNASLTAGANLLDDLQSRLYRVRDLARLPFWAPFDMFLYRPIVAWARFKGTRRFLRGDKAWHKFERNACAPA